MSKISDAMVDTLLDEITDYQNVRLEPEELTTLKHNCEPWEDKDSIEIEINNFLPCLGYEYNEDDCVWELNNDIRAVEMYYGIATGNGDSGTWSTEYVYIPIDTPEDKIEEAGKDKLREILREFAFAGIYHLPAPDDQPY